MKLTDVDGQALSTITAGWFECQCCSIVDTNMERMRKGFVCPSCSQTTDGTQLYFHINIRILIDLIQEAHLSAEAPVKAEKLYKGEGANDVSVVIFFCTLSEALLENLIIRLMSALNLPWSVRDRMMSDNRFHLQKKNKLFGSLAGDKWSEATAKINAESKRDYIKLDNFVANCAETRNEFVHSGRKWSIDAGLRKSCVNNVWELVNFYAALHNLYVQPLLNKPLCEAVKHASTGVERKALN